MIKFKVFTYIFVLILLSSFAYAEIRANDHGQNLHNSGASAANRFGAVFTATNTTTIKNVTYVPGMTADHLYIYNHSGAIELLANITSSGNGAVFDFDIISGSSYRIIMGNDDTSSYTRYWDDGLTYPFASTDLNYITSYYWRGIQHDWIQDNTGIYNFQIIYTLSVDTTPPTFNETPANFTLEYYYDSLYFDLNASDTSGIDNFFINDTANFKIDKETGILENNIVLPVGLYVINVSVNDTLNNIASALMFIQVNDTISPAWNESFINFSLSYGVNADVYFDFNASDISGLDDFFINDTVNFKIDKETGIFENNTVLSVGTYVINVSVNDTSNNINSTLIWVEINNTYSYIDLLFSNLTNPTDYKTVFNIWEEFDIRVNWSNEYSNALTNLDGYCNVTFWNMSLHYHLANDNFTICNVGCDYDTYIDNVSFGTNLSVEKHSVHLYACHLNNIGDDLKINLSCDGGSYTEIIDKSAFPLCSEGTSTISINTSVCIHTTNISVSIENDANNINFGHRIIDADVHAKYYNHTDSLTYNNTNYLWEFPHIIHGHNDELKSINATCIHNTYPIYTNSTLEQINITAGILKIYISQVLTSIGYTTLNSTGTNLFEYVSGEWNWSISITGQDVSWHNFTFYNSTNNPIYSHAHTGVHKIFNVSANLFSDFSAQPYNFTVWANNSNGVISWASILFNTTEDNAPVIIWITPLSDNSTILYNGTNNSIVVTITDENLYNSYLNITNATGHLFYEYVNTSLNTYTTFTHDVEIEMWNWSLGNYYVTKRTCDGHTKIKIEEWDIKQDKEQITYNDDITITANMPNLDEFETEFEEDRYKFKIKIEDNTTDYLEFTITSLYYIDILNTKYLGHLVTGRYWIDFENDLVDYVDIERISQKEVLVKIYLTEDVKEIEFNSIGELNCVTETATFTLLERPLLHEFTFKRFECDTSSTGKAIVFAGFILFIVLIWMYALYTKIPIFNILMGFITCYFAWYVAQCFFLANVLFIVMGLLSIGFGIYYALSNFERGKII